MTSSAYLGLGFLTLIAAAALQYGTWVRLAGSHLRDPDLEIRRARIKRWALFALTYQVTVLVAVGVYVAVIVHTHPAFGWPAPAVGAVIGTALPLQLAVIGISRAARQ